MSNALPLCDLTITVARGLLAIRAHIPELHRLAAAYGQPGTMHGLELLLGSQFARRKRPYLVCFHEKSTPAHASAVLTGAVLLQEYRMLGLPVGVFATADPFGVRTVVGPRHLHTAFCLQASNFLLAAGGRLVLATWRLSPQHAHVETIPLSAGTGPDSCLHAVATRTVQDTLQLGPTAEDTLQTLGKRTRVHMRAARRRFDSQYPEALPGDATGWLAAASDAALQQLNEASLDVISQNEFNHQVRTLCQSEGGFVLGLQISGRWIALVGGWRQDDATWIEWQCNARGFEKLSLGSVLRTYLIEDETRRGTRCLSFHGGTSHSMLHRFQKTPVADMLTRRPGLVTAALIHLVPWICRQWPKLLLRGNFLFDALCTPGLRWSAASPVDPSGQVLQPNPQG